jgi:CDP-diacylglycerol--glycerol-3-phosphate 3-phosphatidyltransferase
MQYNQAKALLTASNVLSFSRGPLAFLFLLHAPWIRATAVLIAMFTDSVDGYLARKSGSTSRFGAVLDPVMDKFFVYFVLSVLFFEHKIELWQALAMITRDLALCIFGTYLILRGKWSSYEVKSIIWGKITTAFQFVVLISISLDYTLPSSVYILFVIFSFIALIELFWRLKFKTVPSRD